MDVYARRAIALMGLETASLALYGSIILKYRTPSILIFTLSFVIAVYPSMSNTYSFKLWWYATSSKNGNLNENPGFNIFLNLPNLSNIFTSC